MRNPLCLWRAVWRSVTRLRWFSGHDFVTVSDTPDNIHVLRCRTCGEHSVAWSWDSLEDQK